jgi:guanylate kinase
MTADGQGSKGDGFDGLERRGLMFVLSSPSGAGKTTLSRLLIERMPGLTLSVSATTRPMRPGEIEGSDYLFVDKARFEAMVKRDELLEWATVFDNRYGTPRAPVERALSAGTDVLFDIAAARKGARRRCQRVHPAAVGRRPGKTAAHEGAGFRCGDPRTDEPCHP